MITRMLFEIEYLVIDNGLAEHHNVFGQRSGLITKHILHLPQLLIEGRRLHLHASPPPVTIHKLVMIDKVFLEHLDNLDGDYEGDGYHGIEQDHIGEEGNNRVDR